MMITPDLWIFGIMNVFVFYFAPKIVDKASHTESWTILLVYFIGEMLLYIAIIFFNTFFRIFDVYGVSIHLLTLIFICGILQAMIFYLWGRESIRRLPSIESKHWIANYASALYLILLAIVLLILRFIPLFPDQWTFFTLVFYRIVLGLSLEILFFTYRVQFFEEELENRFRELNKPHKVNNISH